MSAEPHAQEADEAGAWEFHEGDGPWSGWLFRYADGTLVAEDGTVLEEPEPEDQPDAEPEPVARASRGPGDWVFHDGTGDDQLDGWIYHHTDGRLEAEDGTTLGTLEPQPAPEPTPTPSSEPEPEPAEEPAPAAPCEARGPGDWVFHDGTDDDGDTGLDGWIYHHTDGRLEAEDGTTLGTVGPAEDQTPAPVPEEPGPAAPREARGPGDWVFHDGTDDDGDTGGLDGWIYHHTDGRLEAEDGTTLGTLGPAEDQTPAPVLEESARDERASRRAAEEPAPFETVAVQPPQGAEDEPEPEPEPEPDPEPEAAPEPEPAPQPEPRAEAPAYLRWEASAVPQYVAGAVFAVAAVVAVLLLVDALADPTAGRLVPVVGLALLAGAALLALGWLAPTVVTLRGSTVEVAHGEAVRRFDLAESGVRLDLQGAESSLSWRARLANADGDVELLSRRQVDPREFGDAVRAHRRDA